MSREIISPMEPISTADRPFGLPEDVVLVLPTPPSVNNLFLNLRRGKGRCRSPEYTNWINHAGWLLQGARQKPINGPVCVSLEVQEHPRRDLDGYWKAILDLLVTHRLIPGDSSKHVREIHAVWSSSIEGCRVTVRGTA